VSPSSVVDEISSGVLIDRNGVKTDIDDAPPVLGGHFRLDHPNGGKFVEEKGAVP
jgi:hypothetical protein